MFARQASAFAGSFSSERTRPPRYRTPAAEPEGRVAAGRADLEDLAVHLRRDQGEEELPGCRRDGAGALGRRQAAVALVGVLGFETFEHGPDPVVEHGRDLERGVDLPLHLCRERNRSRDGR